MNLTNNGSEEDYCRDGELSFRVAELLWARIGAHPNVLSRRQEFLGVAGKSLTIGSPREAERFGNDCEAIVVWAAAKWCALFDRYQESPKDYVFSDGFEALLFVRIMWANTQLILRGHYDSRWDLTTSRARFEARASVKEKEKVAIAAQEFMAELRSTELANRAYPSGIPPSHQEAILQHYNFPTSFLDFTYSLDVALYFAEGGSDYLDASRDKPPCGRIYAVPSYALPVTSELVTLSPLMLRPSLQRAVFLWNASDADREAVAKYGVAFAHHAMPVWNGLGSIPFGSPIGLGKYLFPLSDPVEGLASRFRVEGSLAAR